MPTQWDGIEEFLAVAETESFTEAAKQLGVSLSHISRRISQLESRLGGTRLLARTTRRVDLTAAGRDYMHACRHLIEGLVQANAALLDENIAPRGKLRVAAIRGYTSELAVIAISTLVAAHPDLEIELITYSRDFDVLAEGFDVAIANSAASDSALTSIPLQSRAYCMAASPQYLEKYGTPFSPEELSQHKCILSNEPFWLLKYGADTRPLMVTGPIRIHNHIDGLLLAALRHTGIIYFSAYFMQSFIDRGLLKAILPDYCVTDLGTWFIHRYGSRPPRKVTALLEILENLQIDDRTQLWLSALSRKI